MLCRLEQIQLEVKGMPIGFIYNVKEKEDPILRKSVIFCKESIDHLHN